VLSRAEGSPVTLFTRRLCAVLSLAAFARARLREGVAGLRDRFVGALAVFDAEEELSKTLPMPGTRKANGRV